MVRRLLGWAGLVAGATIALTSPAAAGAATVALWHMDETSGTTMTDSRGANHGRLRRVDLGLPGFSGTAYGFAGLGSIVAPASCAPFGFTH